MTFLKLARQMARARGEDVFGDPIKRKTANYFVKIVRLNADGTRDFLNMLEMDKIESAKRAAANWSREPGIYTTIIDVFDHATPIYQYVNGRKVAEIAE